jgi:hypothetical protein
MNRSSGHDGQGHDFNVTTLTAQVAATVQIHLWEDRTRGESWVPAYDPAMLALVSDDFQCVASNNAVQAGLRTFDFKPLLAGTHELVFEKRMGWKFTSEDRRVFEMVVTADPTGAECTSA